VIDDQPSPNRSERLVAPWLQGVLLFVIAFVPRLVTALDGLAHVDERKWLLRSERYARGYLSLDFANATSVPSSVSKHLTMPGITTTAIGAVARVIWGGLRDLGVASAPGVAFRDSRPALIIAQVLMAAATSGLLVLLWWVLTRWASRVVATTAVVLLATEPYLVAEGTKLKTDSFLMLFGAIGAFGLAAALDVPASARREAGGPRWGLAAVAGIGIGGALASKSAALVFLPFFAGIAVYAVVRDWRHGRSPRAVIVSTLVALLSAVVLLATLWPALWADPSGQIALVRGSTHLTSTSHSQFFLGRYASGHDTLFLLYYIVALPFRMTPWLFLLLVPSVIVGLARRDTRGFAVVAISFIIVPFVVITLAERKFTRYALPLWPSFAVLVGLLVQAGIIWCRARGRREAEIVRTVGAGAVVGLVVYTLVVAPYGGTYANPALGAGPVAEQVMQVGGDDNFVAGAFIRDREGARCAERRIFATSRNPLWFPCGDVTSSTEDLRPGDYVVLFANDVKRESKEEVERWRRSARQLADLRVRGIDVGEILQVGKPASRRDSA
jgi:hypothetical protein